MWLRVQGKRAAQVFTLEAGPDVDADLARRQLAKYMGTFRGRALLGPLPLPPAKDRAGAAAQACSALASVISKFEYQGWDLSCAFVPVVSLARMFSSLFEQQQIALLATEVMLSPE